MKSIKNIIYFLLFYIPLEEFLLKWFPVSDVVFETLHNFSDLLILVVLFIFLIKKQKLEFTILELTLFLFLILSIISFLFSQASLLSYFIKMWVLYRYILLSYVVIHISLGENTIARFFKAIEINYYLQIFIGVLQLLNIQVINTFFDAREGLIKIIVAEDAITGTFKYGVLFGYFILANFIILLSCKKRNDRKWILITTAIMFSFYSESRLIFIGVLLFLIFIYSRKHMILFSTAILLSFFFLIFGGSAIFSANVENIGSIRGLFSSQFWIASASSGRVGVFNVVPIFFQASIKDIFIGFSFDDIGITSYILKYYNILPALLRNNVMIGIEDVYWIAFLYYYGVFGFSLFTTFFIYLFKKVNKIRRYAYKTMNMNQINGLKFLLLFAFLSGFVNQSLYIKSFSFYLWLFLALVINLSKSKQIINKQSYPVQALCLGPNHEKNL